MRAKEKEGSKNRQRQQRKQTCTRKYILQSCTNKHPKSFPFRSSFACTASAKCPKTHQWHFTNCLPFARCGRDLLARSLACCWERCFLPTSSLFPNHSFAGCPFAAKHHRSGKRLLAEVDFSFRRASGLINSPFERSALDYRPLVPRAPSSTALEKGHLPILAMPCYAVTSFTVRDRIGGVPCANPHCSGDCLCNNS